MNNRQKITKKSVTIFLHSIRFRLVLWYVVILAIIMGIFSAFIYWRQAQDIRAIAIVQLNTTLERLHGVSEREGSSEALPGFSPTLQENNVNLPNNLQEGSVVALQASDGTVLQSTGPLRAEQIQQLMLPLAGWNGTVQVTVPKIPVIENDHYLFIDPPVLQNGQVAGYLLVGVPLDPNNQLGKLLVSLILGNFLTLAIALTGGFWLADRAMRPVHTITQTVRLISETDLNKRLNLPGRDELAELANTFDAMLDRLQAAFERQRQFTADASHELRTPLTIIDLEASRGLANRRTTGEYDHILQNIQAENQSMIRLVNNLLELARMDAGQMVLKSDPVDLSEVASEVIERMVPLASAHGVALRVGDLPEVQVLGDRSTLIQMLTNLVENAIKYSAAVDNAGVDISIGRGEEDEREIAWARVRDNGIGIPTEQLAHIFDRFYQVDPSRTRASKAEGEAAGQGSSGSGLGLAIAQWIAKAHQGEIRVQSTPGQGSEFEVVLPEYHPVV